MSSCLVTGWGSGAYGMSPWGGGLNAVPGGPLPVELPFDVYCVGPCGPMSVITTYVGVSEAGGADQFIVDPITLDQVLRSGGAFSTTDVRIIITSSVPQVFTFDFTAKFDALPVDFSDLVSRHVFLGVTDAAGPCAGLFFSKSGIMYVGGVHHDGSGNLVVDSVTQHLPNSELLVSETDYWSVRIAANFTTGGVYVYVTKTSELQTIGHQLRYVLPVIPATALALSPTDRTLLSVRGTAGQPAQLSLDSVCLGSGFIVPNLPPIADAGLDQATRTCSIIQLDGSRSFDPEGAAITYKWRLIDAPLGSMFMFDGVDGRTFDTVSGFTNKFYSVSLGTFHAISPLQVGDVLVVAGEPYTITGTATDGFGFHVLVDGFVLLDTLLNSTFKFLAQNGLSGPTTAKPTFLPDLAGLWKFDLVVFDGGITSPASVVVVNVTESPVPRGCIPDVRFVWGYLSNIWNLVDDKDRITTFWSAAAQVAANELLSLWQIDFSKSLRDAQRTFQRRWLHYDPPLRETLPDLTEVRAIQQGCRSVELSTAGTSDFAATTITLTSSALSAPVTFTFPGGALTPLSIKNLLQSALQLADSRFRVDLIEKRPIPSTVNVLRVFAPFAFTLTHNGATPFLVDFDNMHPNGSSGAALGSFTYRVDRSLSGLDITEGDILILDGVGYRILRVTNEVNDTWISQRLLLLDALPSTPPTTWAIPGKTTSSSLDFYSGLVASGDKAVFAVVDNESGAETRFTVDVYGATENAASVLSADTLPLSHFLLDTESYSVELVEVRRYNYIPLDDLVVDIPFLQETIVNKDDSTILRRNLDFYIETFREKNAIRFNAVVWDTPPADTLWAETTYLDGRWVLEQNFGIPAEFTLDDLSELPSNVDYLSAVRGLWYSYFNGPTLFNLRAGSQILLGLPFAEQAGTIEEIRTDFSPTMGRILIRDLENKELVRSYTFPVDLILETNPETGVPYVVGDSVAHFAPLVTGVEVVDWRKNNKWFEGYLNQGLFLEVEKFHKFLVRVDSAAFNLPALLFMQSFVRRIKPTYTFPLFVVQKSIGDTEVSTTDLVDLTGTINLFDGACFINTFGAATMFDEPDASGGGWRSQLDTDSDPATAAPVFPAAQSVLWGLDKNLLCPEDYILATSIIEAGAPFYPTLDSIFALDTEIHTEDFALFQDSWVTFLPAVPYGIVLFPQSGITIGSPGTITDLSLDIVGDYGSDDPNFQIVITKNAGDLAPIAFTMTPGNSFHFHAVVNIPVIAGDVLFIRVMPAGVDPTPAPFWKSISIQLSASMMWALDTQLPAGKYLAFKVL